MEKFWIVTKYSDFFQFLGAYWLQINTLEGTKALLLTEQNSSTQVGSEKAGS